VAAIERERPTRSRRLVHRKATERGHYTDEHRQRRPVVPVRFVRACPRGHLGDIDWFGFVHPGDDACRRQQRQLWIDERGTSGDLSEVWIRCDCGAERAMNQAALSSAKALGVCDGSRPWLGAYAKERCSLSNRLLVRTASNAYFPQTMSVISIPERNEAVTQAVGQVWDARLQYVHSLADLQKERQTIPPVTSALEGLTDDEVLAEIEARHGATGTALLGKVKEAELQTLFAAKAEVGADRPDGLYHARALAETVWTAPWTGGIERVVLVHRLREVAAQLGFTRFEPVAPDIDGELALDVERAPLAREISWLPAVENRGEGIFIGFSGKSIAAWLERPAVQQRRAALAAGFGRWEAERPGTKRRFPGLPYIMLHSLSHLLITAVALECGYPVSSIKERVYAGEAGYGLLIYTGTPDAEGTLGGLVEAGRRIAHHLRDALDMGELCSNDPVCAQHEPSNPLEARYLLGASCHGCLLIAETCCEQHNEYLDRALVVPTVEGCGAEFFRVDASA
jgi:hypothetical protein